MSFRESLPANQRHAIGRFESFGDVVVGFSMSLLALQLDIPKTPDDVFGHASRYLVFFAAFGTVSLFWLRFHRLMSTGFVPHHQDIVLLFAFLAFVALMPYALLTYSRLQRSTLSSPEALMLYIGVFLGAIGFGWLLTLRGMRRAWTYLDAVERRQSWRAFVAGGTAIPVLAAALAVLATNGSRGFSVVIVLVFAIPLARRLWRQPATWVLGVAPGDGTLAAAEVS